MKENPPPEPEAASQPMSVFDQMNLFDDSSNMIKRSVCIRLSPLLCFLFGSADKIISIRQYLETCGSTS